MTDAALWDSFYANGTLPWDSGRSDRNLAAMIAAHGIMPCRVLELGAGPGRDALWLAERGFAVTAVDIAPRAVEDARRRAEAAGLAVDFRVVDALNGDIEGAPFELVYDRGCFHSFSTPEERARFAARVVGWLAPGGVWLSLAGNLDGPRINAGPPRLAAREIVAAVEPCFEILELRATRFESELAVPAWALVMRKRAVAHSLASLGDEIEKGSSS